MNTCRYLACACALGYCLRPILLPTAVASPAAGDDETAATERRLETIYVVGSHLERADLDLQPVLVLDRADLLRTGSSAVGEILQQMTINSQTRNRGANGSGQGEIGLNVRGLGADRTLVLLDGQRWVTTLDGTADLSTIPLVVIDRIEVLRGGAAAIYGADAIAAVVNIVTRRDYDGVEAGAYFGASEFGDGRQRSFDLTWGGSSDRWNIAAGLEYGDDDAIRSIDRAISSVPTYGLPPGATGSDNTPAGHFLVGSTESPELTPIPGRGGLTPSDFRPFDETRDMYNFAEYWFLQTPQERRSAFVQLRYDLTANLSASANLLWDERLSEHQRPPPRLQFNPEFSGPAGRISIAADNLYNPFDEPVPSMFRQLGEAGPRHFEFDVTTTRAAIALEGTLMLGGRDFDWTLGFSSSRAQRDQRDGPFADNERLRLALGPSFRDTNGAAHCGRPGAVVAGCVPLNLLGGAGSVTPEMLQYIVRPWVTRSGGTELESTELRLTGTPADWPAGPVEFATGLEYRSERGWDNPSAVIVRGEANGFFSSAERPTSGSYSVGEAYVELNLPVLSGLRWAENIDINLAARRSDYSTFGDTTSTSLGVLWRPVATLALRGAVSEGFRAPNIGELYQGNLNTFESVSDPCDAKNFPEPYVVDRCREQGVPDLVDQPDPVAKITAGGNPDLEPETSRNYEVGLTYRPQWSSDLELELDWYRIELHDAIGAKDKQQIVDDCYAHFIDPACTRVTRDSTGRLRAVNAMGQNLETGLETEGIDFGLSWHRATGAGELGVQFVSTYVLYYGELGQPARNTPRADGTPAAGDVAGTSDDGVVWRLRANVELSWRKHPWDASLSARYFSPIDEDCSFVTETAQKVGDPSLRRLCSDPDHLSDVDGSGVLQRTPRNEVPAQAYVDLQAGWEAAWGTHFSVGVQNAFDRDPPVAYTAFNSYFSDYDPPGRYWYVSIRQSW
jgi:iron complex outermembrane receptor protein